MMPIRCVVADCENAGEGRVYEPVVPAVAGPDGALDLPARGFSEPMMALYEDVGV